MRLLEDGRIGRGLAKLEVGWQVFQPNPDLDPVMIISDLDGCPTAKLTLKGDVWEGKWLQYEQCPCKLIPT